MSLRNTRALAVVLSAVVGLAAVGVDVRAQQPDASPGSEPAGAIPPDVQQKLNSLDAALTAAKAAGDAKGQANALGAMAIQYKGLQQNQKALMLAIRALALFREAGDRPDQAAALRGIGLLCMALGQPQNALEAANRALAISRELGDQANQALTLNGIGTIYLAMGETQKALEAHEQALEVSHSMGNKTSQADALNLIGADYLTLGDRRKALDNYNQALGLYREIGSRDGEATALGNVGIAYGYLGDGEKALESLNQAAEIYLQTSNRAGSANVFTNIGSAYVVLGQAEKGLDYYNRALPLYRAISNKYGEALLLTNMGVAYGKVAEWQKSVEFLNQAIALEKAISDRSHEALALTFIGTAYAALGDKQKALEALNQALPIRREVGDRDGEALTLDKIGEVYDQLGQNDKAQESLKQALLVATDVANPIVQSMILNDLMLNRKKADPALAVFYGKQAVNLLQKVRGNIQGLDQALQTSFLASKEDTYHDLADLLIAQGRLPEAQQVLDLLKQQEYSDYTRGEAANTLSPLTQTPAEQQAADDYQKSTVQIVALGQEWAELRKVSTRTPEQEARFKQLSDQIQAANTGLSDYYKRLYTLLGANSNANKQIADVKGNVSALNQALAKMPHTVALYTLMGKDRYRVIVISGTTPVAREYAITEEDLNKKIAAFEQVLRSRSSNPRPAAQELYNILVGPVKADLELAHAETLVWSLDGALRYVPMAALYDGKQYLVEKYNTVTITPVSIAHLADKPDVSNMTVTAMGISRKYESDLPALSAVVGELNEVVKDPQVKGASGVLPGTILLDDGFTQKAMEEQLSSPHAVVHIASHFVFKPGDDKQSYLLLADSDAAGKGFHLTVASFNANPNLTLDDTELLTLSACETGMSGTASDGREVDGLGTTALSKGAKAVISTLWEVNDSSTGALMADFYRRWAEGGGKVEKAEALRQAQLDLLQGKSKIDHGAQSGASSRGLVAEGGEKPDPEGFAHPYYWAPFVLMGNWR